MQFCIFIFQDENVGKKTIQRGKCIYVEQVDAQTMPVNATVTLINWGNIIVKQVNVDKVTQHITSIDADADFANLVFMKFIKFFVINYSRTTRKR